MTGRLCSAWCQLHDDHAGRIDSLADGLYLAQRPRGLDLDGPAVFCEPLAFGEEPVAGLDDLGPGPVVSREGVAGCAIVFEQVLAKNPAC